MLFEVRVFDPKGKVKIVIPEKELKKIHWKNFDTKDSMPDKKRGSSKIKLGKVRSKN